MVLGKPRLQQLPLLYYKPYSIRGEETFILGLCVPLKVLSFSMNRFTAFLNVLRRQLRALKTLADCSIYNRFVFGSSSKEQVSRLVRSYSTVSHGILRSLSMYTEHGTKTKQLSYSLLKSRAEDRASKKIIVTATGSPKKRAW